MQRIPCLAKHSECPVWGGSFTANLLLSLRVEAWYLKQLVWPTPFVQYKGTFTIITGFWDWRVLVALLTVGGTFIGGVRLRLRRVSG